MIVKNPLFGTDMPDPDVIRVDDTYYMVSTTMFLMPAAPILKSKDLCHWEIVSYVCDTVEEHENYRLENGKHGYGKGQWATSLCRYKDKFYACFVCHDMGKTFLFSTDDIEKSNWDKVVIDEVFHDMSFLFWENHAYLVYGNGDIEIVELEEDASGTLVGVKKDGLKKLLIETPTEGIGLRCEGCRALVKDGYIYLFFIDWPKDSVRREVCYRSDTLDGPYECKTLLEDTYGREGRGIAQGVVIDTKEGDWFAMMFQDRGASGRIPFLMPAKWENGWPVIGCVDQTGKTYVPTKVEVPFEKYVVTDDETLRSNSFAKAGSKTLRKCWQWNHNPITDCYHISEDGKSIVLTTGQPATGLIDARNTLTQRTIEPGCTCKVQLDYHALKEGDFAGVCAFQGKYGQLGVQKDADGTKLVLKKKNGESYGVGRIVPDKEATFDIVAVPMAQISTEPENEKIWLCIEFDFDVDTDMAYFYYSVDGENWNLFGNPLQMRFTLDMFVGYRIGLFCYATKELGGSAEFSDFEMME